MPHDSPPWTPRWKGLPPTPGFPYIPAPGPFALSGAGYSLPLTPSLSDLPRLPHLRLPITAPIPHSPPRRGGGGSGRLPSPWHVSVRPRALRPVAMAAPTPWARHRPRRPRPPRTYMPPRRTVPRNVYSGYPGIAPISFIAGSVLEARMHPRPWSPPPARRVQDAMHVFA